MTELDQQLELAFKDEALSFLKEFKELIDSMQYLADKELEEKLFSLFRTLKSVSTNAAFFPQYSQVKELCSLFADLLQGVIKHQFELTTEISHLFSHLHQGLTKLLDRQELPSYNLLYDRLLQIVEGSFSSWHLAQDIDANDLKKVSLMIIESSEIQAKRLKEKCSLEGIKAYVTDNALQALELIKEAPPTIVLSETTPNGINGHELCRKIKELYPNLPVILSAVLNDPAEVVYALEAKADSFMTKPYQLNLLKHIIVNVLKNEELEKHRTSNEPEEFYFIGEHFKVKSVPKNSLTYLLSLFEDQMQKRWLLEQSAKELREAKEQVEKASKAKSMFLAHISHDVRGPLCNITEYIQLLTSHVDQALMSPEQAKYVERIKENVDYLLEIMNDILNITVIESGKVQLKIETISVNELVEKVRAVVTLNLEKSGRDFLLNVNTHLKEIHIDETKLTQILVNLLNNANKYATPKTPIYFNVLEDEEYLIFNIRNQGTNIPADLQEKIFDAFERLQHNISGFGLGLDISQKLTQLLGGKLSMTSNGNWIDFFLKLPLHGYGLREA